jgi:alpha-ribazole phosphatase/probable phosphoglycerate mutase
MKITLVRHTEVEKKYHKRYNGHIDIGLSEEGKKQAKMLGEYFHNSSFDAIYCSDLKRARETLAAFRERGDVVYTKALREKSWGKHEGMSFDEIIAEGEISYNNFLQWIEALDGEPYEEYIQRIQKFFLEFLAKQEMESALVITHAGVIRVLMAIVQNLSLEEAFAIDVPYSSFVVFDTNLKTFSTIKCKF